MRRRHSPHYVVIGDKAYPKGNSHRHKHRSSLERSRGFSEKPALSKRQQAVNRFKGRTTSGELTREKGYREDVKEHRRKGAREYAPKAQAVNQQLFGSLALKKRRYY